MRPGSPTTYAYDIANQLETSIDSSGATTFTFDANGNRNSFTYDAAGREITKTDSLNRRNTTAYDVAGRQNLRIDARGNRTTYTFDKNDQVTGRRYPDGSRATFSFDSASNRVSMKDATGTYTATYDALNRAETVVNAAGKNITYVYDALSQRDHIIDPDGGRFTYSYDAADRIDHLINPQGDRTSYSYDNAGRRTKKALANGTYTSFTYDTAGRVTKVANNFSDNTAISVFNYSYDAAGNRTHSTELAGTRITWTYDPTNQLNTEHRDGPNVGSTGYRNTYTYDVAGNRLTKDDGTQLTTSTYDAADQLQATQNTSGVTTYTFDADGNQQIVLEPTGNRTTTTWDYENQPTLYELPSSELVTMTYNADNDRVEKQSDSGTTKFIWDEQNYLLETDGAGVTTCTYTNEPNVYGKAISQRRAGATSYLHFDVLGSTREATNTSETITDTWVYDAWGNITGRTGTTLIYIGYVGELGYYLDPETGLIWVRERPLQPTIARWTTVDPWWPADGLNPFTYAGNNPVIAVDPTGLFNDCCCPGGNWTGFLNAAASASVIYGTWQGWINLKCRSNTNTVSIRFKMQSLGLQAGISAAVGMIGRAYDAPCASYFQSKADGFIASIRIYSIAGAYSVGINLDTEAVFIGGAAGAGFSLRRLLRRFKRFLRLPVQSAYIWGTSSIVNTTCPAGLCDANEKCEKQLACRNGDPPGGSLT